MFRFEHPRRYFNGLLFLLILKAFGKRNGRQLMTRPQKISPLKVLVAALVLILVVLPAICMIGAALAEARWRADHPATVVVPDVRGFEPAAAEFAVRAANLKTQSFSTEIGSRCWEQTPALNRIVDQSPDAFMPALPGTIVRLEIVVKDKK